MDVCVCASAFFAYYTSFGWVSKRWSLTTTISIPSRRLDGRHVVFGKVLEGEAVIKAVEGVGSQSGTPTSKVTVVDSGELK
jgi:cyclophilin family peptidyl-prolyl cis-trans isomerase